MKNNFYTINNIFNEKLKSLYESGKDGKKIIGKYTRLIKEDKILRDEYRFFDQLEEGVSEEIKNDFITESLKRFQKYSKNEIKKSHKKVEDFINENFKKEDFVIEEKENKFVDAVEFVINEGKEYNRNLPEYLENRNIIINEVKIRNNTLLKEAKTVDKMIEDFNEKYHGELTNEEMNIVMELIKVDSNETPTILKEYQKNILSKLNVFIKENNDLELKEKLLQLKEQIMFDTENLKKATNLFEIRKVVDEITTA
jgi:hypothetical protein